MKGGPGPLRRATLRLVRRLQPAALRRRHGTDMLATMEDEWTHEKERGRELHFWVRLIRTGVSSAFRDRMRIAKEELGLGGAAVSLHSRAAVRSLRRSPALLITGISTIALGIGGTVGLFAVGRAMLFEPLPFPDSDALARVTSTRVTEGSPVPWLMSHADFDDIRRAGGPFEAIAVRSDPRAVNVGVASQALSLDAEFVSAGYFELLRMEPVVGRWFAESNDQLDGPAVVALSHALWEQSFGGDPTLIGQTVQINEAPYTVVGVGPLGFSGESGGADLWLPVARAADAYDEGYVTNRRLRWLTSVARLEPGADIDVAHDWIEALGHRLEAQHADTNAGLGLRAVSLRDAWFGSQFAPLAAAGTATLLTLLIVALNLAGLLVARAISARRDAAVCRALGAGRAALLGPSLTTAATLALGGLAVGAVLATVVLEFVNGSEALGLRVSGSFGSIEWGLAFLLSLLAVAVMVGASAGASGPASVPGTARSVRAEGGAGGSRKVFVTGQLALTTSLCVVAVLLGASVQALGSFDLGYVPDGLASVAIDLLGPSWEPDEAKRELVSEVLDALDGAPGVEAVAVAGPGGVPGAGLFGFYFTVERDGVADWADEALLISYHSVTTDYFGTMGMRIREGRGIEMGDRDGAPGAAVVTRSLARRMWPDGEVLGRTIRLGRSVDSSEFHVVGIVDDPALEGRTRSPELAGPEHVFLPLAQEPPSRPARLHVVVRSSGDDVDQIRPQVEGLLGDVHPGLPVGRVRDLSTYLDQQTAGDRFVLWVATGFATMALLLATLGVHGMVSQHIARRRLEFGIRLAVGADPVQLGIHVLRSSARLIAAGLVAGLLIAVALSRSIEGMLYEVDPVQPGVLALVSIVILASGLAGAGVPAWKIARRGVPPGQADGLM